METPRTCPECGQRYEPYRVLVGYLRCDCPGQDPGGGHTTRLCRRCLWETWPGCTVAPGRWWLEREDLRVE